MKIIITESQLSLLVEQQVQKITIQNEDGSSKTFMSNSPEWSKFYYSPEFKQYKWDGQKYVIDYSKIYKNWGTMTPDEKKTVLANRQRVKASGSYKEQPNLISMGFNEFTSYLKNVVWNNLTFDNLVEILSKLIQFVPPPYGGPGVKKGVELAHALSYIVRFYALKDTESMASNFINGLFKALEVGEVFSSKFLPSKIQELIKNLNGVYTKYYDDILASPIGQKLSGTFLKLPKFLQLTLVWLQEKVGDKIKDFIKFISENIIKTIMNFVAPYNLELQKTLGEFINYLNQLTLNLDSAKSVVTYLKQKDPNALT
jgi:hypothetical protein